MPTCTNTSDRCKPKPRRSKHVIRCLPARLKKSGTYRLKRYLDLSASCKSLVAIEICGSKITLDLKGFGIKQSDQSKSIAGVIGILVQQNVRDIKIINGTAEGFSLLGLLVLGGVVGLKLDRFSTPSCGYNGYFTTSVVLMTSEEYSGGAMLINTDRCGNQTQLIQDVQVTDCHFDGNCSNTAIPITVDYVNLSGLAAFGVQNLWITRSTFSRNTSNILTNPNESFVQLNGLSLTSCTNVQVLGCQMAGNQGQNTVAVVEGLYISLCQGVIVKQCAMQGQSSTNPGYDGLIGGIDIFVQNSDILVEDCVIQDTLVDGLSQGVTAACGVFFGYLNTDLVFRRCTVQNVSFTTGLAANSDLGSVGFIDSGGNTNITLDSCIAQNVSGSGSPTTGAYGFLLAEASNYTTVKNCQALSIANVSSTAAGTVAAGFALGYSPLLSFFEATAFDTTLENCVTENITTVAGGTAYGYYVTQCQTGYLKDCVAMDSANGFFLDVGTSNFTVEDCEAANNTSSGFTDNSGNGGTTLTNIFKKNEASYNSADASTGNYVGVPEAWIVPWNASSMAPPPLDVGLLNISVM